MNGAVRVALCSNVKAFLFDTVTYELCDNMMDHVRNPGRVTTSHGYLSYNLNSSKTLVITGWNFSNPPIINDYGYVISYVKISIWNLQ